MFLLNQVLPIMLPFNFGEDDFNIDDSISVTCSITKGDLPLKIWWNFQEEGLDTFAYNLSSNDGIVITQSNQKVSMLSIEALKARHRGNYTCFAQNRAGSTSHSAYLAINGLILIHSF
jgi:hypothetical protein